MWCCTTAGQRLHGTTKAQPLGRFEATEQKLLKPLPSEPYDLAVWKAVKLHRDGYIVFEGAYYSAPFRLVGQTLWVRGGSQTVQLYTHNYELVATHTRAAQPGDRLTHPDHLPPQKLPGALWTREMCQAKAAEVGPATAELVATLLADSVVDRHSRVVRILSLRERVGDARLEKACRRALRFGDLTYTTLKRILAQGLEAEEVTPSPTPTTARTFVRTASDLLGHVFGGLAWN